MDANSFTQRGNTGKIMPLCLYIYCFLCLESLLPLANSFFKLPLQQNAPGSSCTFPMLRSALFQNSLQLRVELRSQDLCALEESFLLGCSCSQALSVNRAGKYICLYICKPLYLFLYLSISIINYEFTLLAPRLALAFYTSLLRQ